MKCPICNTEMEHWDDCMDFTLLEREDKCVDGCRRYVEHFITGGYEVGILDEDWHTWQWNYVTPIEAVKILESEIKQAIAHVKAKLMCNCGTGQLSRGACVRVRGEY